MKEKTWCEYEQKEVNIYHYPCKDNFDCDNCSRLKEPPGNLPQRNTENESETRKLGRTLKRVSPAECKSPDIYVALKMGALIGASTQWGQAPTKTHIVFLEQREKRELEERMEKEDEQAVLDYISYPNDPSRLTHPSVLACIRKWQDAVVKDRDEEARNKLRRVGASLVPDMRGQNPDRIRFDEDVFKSYWKQEWLWYHVERDLRNSKIRNKEVLIKKIARTYEQYDITKECIEQYMGELFTKRSRYRYVAACETAKVFSLSAKTIQNLLSDYE